MKRTNTNEKSSVLLRGGISCLAILLLLSVSGILCRAQQTTGDVLGTVTDSTGAVVAGATVTIQNLGTQEARTTQTSESGDYVFNLLNPGTYSVTATKSGFKKFSLASMHLAAGDRTRVNIQFVLGSASETVLVNSEPPALQTDSSVMLNTIGGQTTQDMPLNGRNFVQLLQITPGANEGPASALSGGTQLDDARQSAAISVNGQSDVLNNEMIDGADNNERLIGTIAVRPSLDAIAEMSIQSNTYTAEVGRTGGAIVNVITKSGTNQFHGDVFEYFRNDVFDASAYQFGGHFPRSEERLNQFGGSMGGPILRDKTFFFGGYEGYRSVVGQSPSTSIVPTAYELAHPGDFSDLPGNCPPSPAPSVNPQNCYTFFPAPTDPAGLAYFEMYPAANYTVNGVEDEFIGTEKVTQNSTDYDARVDQVFNSKNQLYGRFIYNSVLTNTPGTFPNATAAGKTVNPNFFADYSPDLDFDSLVDYIHTFNSNLLLELKAAYTYSDNQAFPVGLGLNLNAAFGQPNVNTPYDLSTALAPVIVANGAGLGGGGLYHPLQDRDNEFQYLGAVTWTHGRHNVKMGATVIRRDLTSVQSNFAEGIWVFLTYPDLLQGQYVTNNGRSVSLDDPHLRLWEPGVYVQDDWHVSNSLTLNLGVRYDHFTPFSEIENRISTFDPSDGALLVAGQNGVSRTAGIQPDYHGLAPRVGFAYTLGHGTVVRGGYGIGYTQMNYTAFANLKNIPFEAANTACGWYNCGPGYTSFVDGLPPIVPGKITDPGAAITAGTDPHFRTSYFQQFNLTLQKELGANVVSASYIGVIGRQLRQYLSDFNAPPPNTCGTNAACYNALRPYYGVDPELGTVDFIKTGGNSYYNALQVTFQRRLSHGVTADANYQFAHNIDDIDGISEQNFTGGYGSVPSEVDTRDRSNSDLDNRSRIAGTIHYDIPLGKSATGAEALAIKDWQFNVIGTDSTGQPFDVVNETDVDNTHPGATGADRPNEVGNWKVSNPGPHEYFNTAAFQAQTPGTLGGEGRNSMVGPHWRHLDFSLIKVFPVRESLHAEFRAEAFNIMNSSNFGTPNNDLNGTFFGAITAMSPNYQPREFQFALKLSF